MPTFHNFYAQQKIAQIAIREWHYNADLQHFFKCDLRDFYVRTLRLLLRMTCITKIK
jgi:hypothetical protein